MTVHTFHLDASWPGGRNEVGVMEAGNLKTEISIPPEMDGPGIGTNPDEMLLGAAATCYLITVAAMIERANLPLSRISLQSEGKVDVTNGIYTYLKIIHKPFVKLKADATEKDMQQLKKIVHAAESSCMISRAVKGNVAIELEEDLSFE
ncbi:peroxiredoxin, SACOL1771 subfamily [Gracilibacillus ureilyticus]|uniref:Peroxiredoxin, SACOL1771 subfamily n=1 Tax=Gracilibacillus ureilyticus TaxID=531814 RepID=A0A1H9SXN3_9BACI|nr:OsmC family protein [Gracilibacillus ureilyticus]SER89133.1 peroxiredoxin, SACOL1771 subfamily [Gracilibacillus ureilyticus]